MHEFSIVSSLYDIIEEVARENSLVKVYRVSLIVGKMRQVVPVAMEMAFEAITKGTIAEGAELQLEFVPIKMQCRSCGHQFTVDEHVYICPKCEAVELDLVEGQELLIKQIEGEN
ncbi:MAG: hydrogenase maturation nickel metallochaperone HypA [Spirochaetae bacterium HGW-Spirochaetae-1]|jgi:hydrogenase nickel incorporation protein HypA/HybF|nr:MAG: hydrogenase maturation nickel metallochaperone HypA [Spirochaetae bacterium HGW-Spirochaetae-1]